MTSTGAATTQPTAPYLEAVTAYGFRGLDALSRARAQGRRGRRSRPAPRARRAARCCSTSRRTSRGSTSGPSPTPYERAEQLAADGIRGRAHLVPHQRRDAGQPRAVPGAGAARRAGSDPAQLAREPDRRARAERRHGELRGARVRRRAGDGARRHAGGARARARRTPRRRARRSSSRPTYYGMAADVGGLRRGRAPRRRARLSSTARGARTSAFTRAARVAAAPRRGRDDRLDAQDRRQPHAVGDAALSRTATGSTSARSLAPCGWCARRARARC